LSTVEKPRDWNAASYDRLSDPQLGWGVEVLERLQLRGDETVLDAGCGTGRVTKLLAERLPRGRVIGVDASPSMIELARRSLGEDAELICADLVEVDLPEPASVDVVFSTATFHWIRDHDALHRNLHRQLKPRGRIVAQCGGVGNIAMVRAAVSQVTQEEPFAKHFAGWGMPWNFKAPEEETAILERAGFIAVECWLQRKTVEPDNPREYLTTVCLGSHLERLPEELRADFVSRVASHMPNPNTWRGSRNRPGGREAARLEYVRLNIDATRDDQ
jgi:trans-aconitate 2-methyltransferase